MVMFMIDPYDISREAGAGSYPEPPDLPEFPEECCDECGIDDVELVEVDGRNLCSRCRGDLYMEQVPQVMWQYVTQNSSIAESFFLDFWFKSLSDKEKVDIIRGGFTAKYVDYTRTFGCFNGDGGKAIEEFVRQDREDLAHFVEREGLY